MTYNISTYPGSFLTVDFNQGEQLITEKGSFIYCDGAYSFENKFETRHYANWLAKVFGGKSLSYALYTAQESLKMALSTKDNAEIFQIDIIQKHPILFEPNAHFARTPSLEVHVEKKDWKSTLNDGLKLKTIGDGTLFLKGYGKIIVQELDTKTPVFVDETALIAFEESLELTTISKGIKETLTSGEGFMFSIKGKGKIWLQTRNKAEHSSGGGMVEGVFNVMK